MKKCNIVSKEVTNDNRTSYAERILEVGLVRTYIFH